MSEALLALPFGLAIGLLLGSVGGGGSILAVPVLVYVLGQPVREATTVSLLVVAAAVAVGALTTPGTVASTRPPGSRSEPREPSEHFPGLR